MVDSNLMNAQRKRKLADYLMQNAMTPGQGQMIGRYYVGEGIGGGLAKLGQALLARKFNTQADAAEQGAIEAQNAAREQAMGDFMRAVTPREEVAGSYPIAGNMIEPVKAMQPQQMAPITRTVKPTGRDIGLALLKAQNAGLDLGDNAVRLITGDAAPVEALGVTQVDRDGNVWNLDKSGRWNKAPFTSQPKQAEAPKTRTIEVGGLRITQEWNGSDWVNIGEAPRTSPEQPKPQLVQTENGYEWVTPGQTPSGKPKPAGGAEPSEGERKAAASGLVMDNAESNFFGVNGGNGMSASGYYASQLPGGDFVLSDTDQKAKQAMVDWYREKLRLESGATIGDNEAYEEAKRYFPVPGDKPQTIAQKADARKVVMEGLRLKAGRAAKPAAKPASAPAPADIDELLKKYGGK